MTVKTIKHAILGNLMPVQGPFATYQGQDDDYDLALYIDGPVWLVQFDIDYLSRITNQLEEVKKELALDVKYLEAYGRGFFTAKFEELYDTVAKEQLSFLPIAKVIEIRESIMRLMAEAYERLDRGEKP